MHMMDRKTITIRCADCGKQLETSVNPTASRAEDRRIQFNLLNNHKRKECPNQKLGR